MFPLSWGEEKKDPQSWLKGAVLKRFSESVKDIEFQPPERLRGELAIK